MLRTFSPRRTFTARDERGAAMVLVAVTLPVLVLFVAFGIEVGHWYDYSRNLQNRADAAALAAAVAYGNTCSSSPTAAQTDVIGKVAQQYAGPPNGDTTLGNLPYPFGSIANYKNQPNLTKGAPTSFHMLLNSTQNYPAGVNWSMGTSGHTSDSTALCSSQDEDGNVGPMVDVRLTQANIPLFFPLFGFTPTISAHARAALEGETSTIAAPIAVGDTGNTPCVSVRLVNATTNALIQTVTLAKEPQANNSTAPVQWDNSGQDPSAPPVSFTMPSSDNVYVQPFLSDCNGNGQTFDDSTNTGLMMINKYPSTPPTVTNTQAPQLNTGGVIAFYGNCPNTTSTPYFTPSGADCTVEVDASVAFGVGSKDANLTLVQHQWDNVNNVWTTTQNAMHLSGNGANACQNTADYCTSVLIPDSSGIDQFSLNWSQTAGSVGGTTCGTGNGQSPPPCTGQIDNGAILQQVFGACNGCDQPDDSGPVVFSRISEADNNGNIIGNDTNAFAGGSQHKLVFTLKLSGLNVAAATDPATVLRFANSTNHQTGLVDCGQGQSGSNDSAVVYYGCGPNNPLVPGMNPLFVYSRPPGSDCSPATDGNTTGWPNGNQQDCVQTTPGQRRTLVVCPLVERIVGAPFGGNCQGGASGTCPVNNWRLGLGSAGIPVGDPRAITMIITSDVDLATGTGQPQAWVPIRKFATFYVTGWDSSIQPSCTSPSLGMSQNEAFPAKGKKNSQNGAVWGHWINYEDTAGTPNGQLCVPGVTPTNCVPALTR
jgi:Putative Flp pilus-assembly TadE/G-like